ncbi:transporter substrate-binding domain-containing protein [Treponema primitia]|uniref:ATP-binding protein n=1 Tax=Treponema primitia TaxID=88058 RepID=UPI00397F020E
MRLNGQKVFTGIAGAVLLIVFASCGNKVNSGPSVLGEYDSYRDIPGVTREEINVIENVRRSTAILIYGMTLSTECFRGEDGNIQGFSVLVCNWLSELFGTKFRPVIYSWDALLQGLENSSIAFTGEISSSLGEIGEYFMTDSIAERRIKFVSVEGSGRLAFLANSRPLKYGFLRGTTTEALVSPYVKLPFEPAPVANYNEAYQKLIRKEIDALFMDETVEGLFAIYNNLIIEDFLPLSYNQVAMATQDPRLRAFISVVQKYLQSTGSYRFAQMYDEGAQEYLRYNLLSRLTHDERILLDRLQEAANAAQPQDAVQLQDAARPMVAVSIEADNYPVSFYNPKENEWQGITIDLLREISALTGIQFNYANSPDSKLVDVIAMLHQGQASMTMELVRSPSNDQEFLFADTPYQIDYYALISKNTCQDVTLSDIPYKRVGLVSGTTSAGIFHELFPRHTNMVSYADRETAINALARGDIELLMATRNLLLNITNYLERTGYKANLVLRRPYEAYFGFGPEENLLCSIISKTQSLIDTERVVDDWTRRVFDYSGAMDRSQKPYLIGVSALLAIILVLLTVMLLRKRQMAANLERTVEQRTHELEVQTKAAQVASRAKGEFLSRMSHEIRTPLNAIIGMTEIARRAHDIEKKDRSLGEIASASDHLLGILNDVLDMSKIESGKFEIVHNPFVLAEAMKEVSKIIILRCQEKGINFGNDFAGITDICVMGDKLRLKQILINLLGNAVKFTPNLGTIIFKVQGLDRDEKRIKLYFHVSDSGIGMNAEQMENLFTAFEQADSSISVRFGGTGLGLAISQNLVKQMGGLITVKSVPGEGSAFSFTLDMDIAEMPREEAPQKDTTVKVFPGKRILLAEDIDINRMILQELLSDTHVKIDEAPDGAEAVKIFAASPENYYDLIFMDIQMPNLNGHDASRKIRAMDRGDAKTVPIIAMTANAYREDIDRALAAGMNGHLAKPVDIDEVMKVLSQRLG